jgi:acyl-CoA thioester hydrolase
MAYQKTFEVRWTDCDPNGHLRASLYAELCTHVRFSFLTENGFSYAELVARKLGPVVLHDETDYLRELRLGDVATIDLRLLGLSDDGSRWRLVHRIFRPDGATAAKHKLNGGWLDLSQRKLTVPPDELAAVLRKLERVEKLREP